ncbi:DDE-type integrase/transposase/recombinase, partial [Mycobacterium helveticum]
FAFIDDHSRLLVGYRFGFAEDTVRLAAALRPALSSRGVPAGIYVDNGSAFVDAWLLRACAKLGIRLVHSTPGRPQGRGKIERFFRTVREQFLVEVTDTASEDLAAAGVDHTSALLELNRLFMAWVETEYHRRVHTETGQPPLDRWGAGWDRVGRTPAIPSADDLTEAFLWSEYRVVTKTATVSLHANTYQVDAGLVGRKVELVFSPFDLEAVEVRYRDKSFGKALPHTISRHAHPKARPETPQPEPPPATEIDYLRLTADAHHAQLSREERIGFNSIYINGQIPGQLSIADLTPSGDVDNEGEVSA